MASRISLGIFFGGRSCEHEVSVISARSVISAIDRAKYDVSLIGIDKSGHWQLAKKLEQLIVDGSVKSLRDWNDAKNKNQLVSIELHNKGNLISLNQGSGLPSVPQLDVIFPILHGTFGEDGTLQGVLEMTGVPYVGCGVAASALAMDKALAKKVFESEGILQAPYKVIRLHQWQHSNNNLILSEIEHKIGYPAFVKPTNMGSSIGISKVNNRHQLMMAINHAFDFDRKIVIEKSMENCREVECSVLGNNKPIASVVGEIIPGAEFYNYETKYQDDKSQLVVPANLGKDTIAKIQEFSIKTFRAIDGTGLARVDFFVNKDSGAIILNEINTMPGFTPISMYPQLWAASGIPYSELIDRLIALTIKQHQLKQSLRRSF